MSDQYSQFVPGNVEAIQQLLNGTKGNPVIVRGTTDSTANTNTAFTHNGGRIPRGIIVYFQDKAGSVYDGGVANTATVINLRGSVASILFEGMLVF